MALSELDLSDTAEECRRHDREHCQVWADVLDDCAESCRQTMQAA